MTVGRQALPAGPPSESEPVRSIQECFASDARKRLSEAGRGDVGARDEVGVGGVGGSGGLVRAGKEQGFWHSD